MGVWSSISCRFNKRRNTHNYESRNSSLRQALNIDSNIFSTLVLQDMQEIRIQESDQFQDSFMPLLNYQTIYHFPTYFEYSMGGNLKFYKEHFQQAFGVKNKLYSLKNPQQQLRKSSHSDNDSEPEALRYVLYPPENAPIVNTIAEEPELSFDDYSSIYQPEFMLNINSKSLVLEVPKVALRNSKKETEVTRQKGKHVYKPSRWSPDLIENSSEVEKLVVRAVLTSDEEEMFNHHSSSFERKKQARKELDSKDKTSKANLEVQQLQNETTENRMSKKQEKKSVKCASMGGKKEMKIFENKSMLKKEIQSIEIKTEAENKERILVPNKSKESEELTSLVQNGMNTKEVINSTQETGKGKEKQEKKPLYYIRQANKETVLPKRYGDKDRTVYLKPRKPNILQHSYKYTERGNKTVLLKDESSKHVKKKCVNEYSLSPPGKVKRKMDPSNESEEKKEMSKSLLLNSDMSNAYYDSVLLQVKNTLPSALDKQRNVLNSPDNFLTRSSMGSSKMFDDVDLFKELEIASDKELSEPKTIDNEDEFYPESPISELHFFKTPCSTRQNSLEIFEQIENECIEERMKEEDEKTQDITGTPITFATYKNLPREYQEIARRLSKRNDQSPKKPSPTVVCKVNSFLNFSCSYSTCSTMSPRSPSGRTLFRTPSYKMPKTPSLSRQHPSTYVTQHTSSRSRPSSRVSSRAASPTREHIEALL